MTIFYIFPTDQKHLAFYITQYKCIHSFTAENIMAMITQDKTKEEGGGGVFLKKIKIENIS